MPEYENFINGEWDPSKSGKTFKNVNPADISDIIGTFQDSDQRDVDEAVAAAAGKGCCKGAAAGRATTIEGACIYTLLDMYLQISLLTPSIIEGGSLPSSKAV